MDLESHGRSDIFDDIDLSRTVGWFTALHSVSLRLPEESGESDPTAALKSIKEQLRQIPHDGIGYGIMRFINREKLPQGTILFNYLGQYDQAQSDSLFRISTEDVGDSHSPESERPYPIEINGHILDGSLSLTWTYSREQYREQTVQTLADDYHRQLLLLIEHCSSSYGYTPSDFPLAALNQSQLDQLTQRYQNNIEDIYPLSPLQQGMLFQDLFDPGSGLNFHQLHFRLTGKPDAGALQRSWEFLVKRYPVFRTAFLSDAETPLQVVFKIVELPWQNLDWSDLTETQREERLEELLMEERKRGFDLSRAPLLRFQFIKETPHLL